MGIVCFDSLVLLLHVIDGDDTHVVGLLCMSYIGIILCKGSSGYSTYISGQCAHNTTLGDKEIW